MTTADEEQEAMRHTERVRVRPRTEPRRCLLQRRAGLLTVTIEASPPIPVGLPIANAGRQFLRFDEPAALTPEALERLYWCMFAPADTGAVAPDPHR